LRGRSKKRMVKITLYGGANQIGGNKVLLEDRDTRIFLDFGEPFGWMDEYFVDFLKPRDRFGLRDYFHFNLMPKIRGLYDEEMLKSTDFRYAPPEFDAILLSHMHFDHVRHVKFADRKIPVYLGAAAEAIRQSWEETTVSADFGYHKFNKFRTGSKIKIGGVEIEPVHVDHSVPGAYGFIIHTSAGCVVYTGDLRVHGPRKDMTEEFKRRAAAEKPIAMICEGTRVSEHDPREEITEKGVEEKARRLISGCKSVAVVSFYPKDVDRMRTFRDVARSTGRKFVVSTKVAHLLGALKGDPRIKVPDPLTDPNMLVYVRSGMKRPKAFEARFLDEVGKNDHIVDSVYVSRNQQRLIFHTDFSQLGELVDVKPRPGGVFIRSMSEPFEEDDVQEPILENWLRSFGLGPIRQAHASGHASMQEIFSMVRQISPRLVIPIHTEHPELFRRCSNSVRIPRARECIELT
jgi:ribonuclease J